MLEVESADPVLVAWDPGGTTGVAMFRATGMPGLPHTFTSGQIDSRFEVYDQFDRMAEMGVPLIVVCESFIINSLTARKTQQLDALYIIGHLEAQCRKLGYPFHLSPPSNKRFATDDKLKAVGFYAVGKGHANDAARHALHFTLTQRLPGYETLLGQITAGVL